MTEENQRIRECLKAAECRITIALQSQPEDNAKCKEHLLGACREVLEIVKKETGSES